LRLPIPQALRSRVYGGLLFALATPSCSSILGFDFDDLHRRDTSGASGGQGGNQEGGSDVGARSSTGSTVTTNSGSAVSTGEGASGGGAPLGPALPLVCGDMAGLQAGAVWPMAGFCPTRQARSEALGFSKASELWVVTFDGAVYSEPVVAADGTVYVVTANDDLNPFAGYRLQAIRGGAVVWFVDLTNAAPAPAISSDGTLVLCEVTKARWISPAGVQIHEESFGGAFDGSPLIGPDGTIYSATTSGVTAFNQGGLVWEAPVDGANTGVARGLDGELYVGTVSGDLTSLKPDGSVEWEFHGAGAAQGLVVVAGADAIVYPNEGQYLLGAA
jgi:hypothetical protein